MPNESVTGIIAAVGATLITCGEHVVARDAVESAVTRLAALLRQHHTAHPLDPGMSLQALRAAARVPGNALDPEVAVVDHVVGVGTEAGVWEVEGSVVRERGWRPSFDADSAATRERLLQRLTDAQWQVPTLAELEQEFPGEPVQGILAHLIREGAVEQVDRERAAPKQALQGFLRTLEAVLQEVGEATPAQLRDRLGVTRKYLIPLLEWADRRGITQRAGDRTDVDSIDSEKHRFVT